MGKLDLNKFKFLCEYGFKVNSKNINEEDEIDLGELKDEIIADSPELEDTESEPSIEEPVNSDEEEIEVSVDDNELEIDLSPIDDKAQKALDTAEGVSGGIADLLAKFEELQMHLSKMDDISNKIESLEKEIEVRNPTPVEKLQIRALNSFPYNQTLTSFWDEKEGYEVSADDVEEEQEFTLSQKDIENDYNEQEISKTFDVK